MAEEKKSGKWGQKLALAAAMLLITAIAVTMGSRKPWIEPLPGVRVEMTRPFLKENDLGPESAYKLLLQAIKFPPEAARSSGSERIWESDFSDAQTKFDTHGWPASPPPPAAKPEPPPAEPTEPEDEEDPMFGPLVIDGVEAGSEPEGDMLNGGMFGSGRDNPAIAAEAPWTLEQYQDILRLLDLLEPNIEWLDRALAAPDPQVPTADTLQFDLSYLSEVGNMARWLSVSARYRASTADYEGAFRDLGRALRMGSLISRGGTLTEHLVCFACEGIAGHTAWGIATREDVPAPILKQTGRDFLAVSEAAEPFVEAMRNEAISGCAIVSVAYTDDRFIDFLICDSAPQEKALVRTCIRLSSLAGSTPQASTRNLRACYQHLIAIAEKPYSAAVQAEYDAFQSRVVSRPDLTTLLFRTRDPFGRIVAVTFLPALERAHQSFAHHDAALRGTALFLAVKAYEKEHGELPERLDQLVPDYLPRVPKDPFDSKPFRYLRGGVPGLPPETWAVYSIGPDFADDGGTAHSVGKSPQDHTVNPDLVWPSQPYPPKPLSPPPASASQTSPLE